MINHAPLSGFTLLDDSNSETLHPTSRLYTGLQCELTCEEAAQFPAFIAQMQRGLHEGLFAVSVFSYELGAALQGLALPPQSEPLARILLYRHCQRLDREQVGQWLAQQAGADLPAGVAALAASEDEQRYNASVARIQQYIAAGDTYQVNYTFRIHFETYGHLPALYQRLRTRQAVPFGALIALPDGTALLSLSPELFIRHRHGQLTARPMKGTAAAFTAGTDAENDKRNALLASQLAADQKNRAENVMIVDLLRNDLSRIAQLGSVKVSRLFQVERFNTVLQMTSSIDAELDPAITLPRLLQSIFPCGSITGAPKHRSMQIIEELEVAPRGVYTGAIGWFDPAPGSSVASVPDFCLSVPIRTLYLQPASSDGRRQGVMGVGAGIVFDSIAADEFLESRLKASFLTGLPAQFALFETMFASAAQGCRHLDRHLQRLSTSAAYFGIPLNQREIRHQLELACASLLENLSYRMKLKLEGDGQVHIQSWLLAPLAMPVQLLLAPQPTQSDDLWLKHKTTRREVYDQAWQQAEQQGAFDMLFCNERGELTEGGRSTLLLKIDGQWLTPPLACGVLPGVMRSVLMDDPAWELREKILNTADLARAEQIAVCNALRGVMGAAMSA